MTVVLLPLFHYLIDRQASGFQILHLLRHLFLSLNFTGHKYHSNPPEAFSLVVWVDHPALGEHDASFFQRPWAFAGVCARVPLRAWWKLNLLALARWMDRSS